jgi:trafficking protein particle complex subunit 10
MGEMEYIDSSLAPTTPLPIDKLKEALGSKQQFQMHYLELAELAMGTYKHIGRLRYVETSIAF